MIAIPKTAKAPIELQLDFSEEVSKMITSKGGQHLTTEETLLAWCKAIEATKKKVSGSAVTGVKSPNHDCPSKNTVPFFQVASDGQTMGHVLGIEARVQEEGSVRMLNWMLEKIENSVKT